MTERRRGQQQEATLPSVAQRNCTVPSRMISPGRIQQPVRPLNRNRDLRPRSLPYTRMPLGIVLLLQVDPDSVQRLPGLSLDARHRRMISGWTALTLRRTRSPAIPQCRYRVSCNAPAAEQRRRLSAKRGRRRWYGRTRGRPRISDPARQTGDSPRTPNARIETDLSPPGSSRRRLDSGKARESPSPRVQIDAVTATRNRWASSGRNSRSASPPQSSDFSSARITRAYSAVRRFRAMTGASAEPGAWRAVAWKCPSNRPEPIRGYGSSRKAILALSEVAGHSVASGAGR